MGKLNIEKLNKELDMVNKRKERYINHYRILCKQYFDDISEEGQLWKLAKIKESEMAMEIALGIPKDQINIIYSEEYNNAFRKDVI